MGLNQMGAGTKSPARPTIDVDLQSGQAYTIPSGQYMVSPGKYTFLQYYDPVLANWRNLQSSATPQVQVVSSDGTNYRLYNATGTCVGAIVTNGGTADTTLNGIWPAATSTSTTPYATADSGTTKFNVIIGGAVSTSVTVSAAGTGYTKPPIVRFSAPPAGGVQATGYSTLSGTTVTSVTVTNQGGGYSSAPTITLVNDSTDTTGSGATATAALDSTNSGKVVALVCTVSKSSLTAVSTIAFSNCPASAAATAIMCFTGSTVANQATTNMGNGSIGFIGSSVTSGSNTTTNPQITTGLFTPRLGYTAWSSQASGATTIIDGGLHQIVSATNTANVVYAILPNGTTPGAATPAACTYSSAVDRSLLLPI